MKAPHLLKISALSLAMFGSQVFATDWQPASTDQLVQLPANIIEHRIEQDFQTSPMATRMSQLEQQLRDKAVVIGDLAAQVEQLEGEAKQAAEFELINEKSTYLDLMEENHTLRMQSTIKRRDLYNKVLNSVRSQSNQLPPADVVELQRVRQDAEARMEQTIARMTQTNNNLFGNRSAQDEQFANNVTLIEQGEQAIRNHPANQSPIINGESVTTEDYLRSLLIDSGKELAILDQEALLLSQMATLVALDADNLKYTISYGDNPQPNARSTDSTVTRSASLFF